jgi:hypothetical protein
MYKYKVWQHGVDDVLEQVIIETDEDYDRLMAHAHIHSAERIAESVSEYVKDEPIEKNKKKKFK